MPLGQPLSTVTKKQPVSVFLISLKPNDALFFSVLTFYYLSCHFPVTPAVYSRSPQFISEHRYQLSLLLFFMIFFSPSRQIMK